MLARNLRRNRCSVCSGKPRHGFAGQFRGIQWSRIAGWRCYSAWHTAGISDPGYNHFFVERAEAVVANGQFCSHTSICPWRGLEQLQRFNA